MLEVAEFEKKHADRTCLPGTRLSWSEYKVIKFHNVILGTFWKLVQKPMGTRSVLGR